MAAVGLVEGVFGHGEQPAVPISGSACPCGARARDLLWANIGSSLPSQRPHLAGGPHDCTESKVSCQKRASAPCRCLHATCAAARSRLCRRSVDRRVTLMVNSSLISIIVQIRQQLMASCSIAEVIPVVLYALSSDSTISSIPRCREPVQALTLNWGDWDELQLRSAPWPHATVAR